MHKPYSQKQILTEPLGNNAFAWQKREVLYGHSPILTIPSLIDWTVDDIAIGDDIVFEELEDWVLKSCKGLRNFVRIVKNDENSEMGLRGEEKMKAKNGETEGDKLSESDESNILMSEANEFLSPSGAFGTFHSWKVRSKETKYGFPPKILGNDGGAGFLHPQEWQKQEILIFDNHNHALYFWCDAVRRWIIEPWFQVIHIDEHSDLWENHNNLDLEKAIREEQYAWEFTNLSCNVGNYIQPALRCGLVHDIIRVENEYQIDECMEYSPRENTVLNIDIDIFAPELKHIPEEKKIQIIKNLLKKVKYVTIATSPYFIDQCIALQKLHQILETRKG